MHFVFDVIDKPPSCLKDKKQHILDVKGERYVRVHDLRVNPRVPSDVTPCGLTIRPKSPPEQRDARSRPSLNGGVGPAADSEPSPAVTHRRDGPRIHSGAPSRPSPPPSLGPPRYAPPAFR